MRRGALIAAATALLAACGYPTAAVMDGVIKATLTEVDGYDTPCLTVTGNGPGVASESKLYCDDSGYQILAVTDTILGALPFTAVMYDESVFIAALTDPDDAVTGFITTETGEPWSVGLSTTHLDGSILVVTTETGTERLALTSGEATVWP